MYCKHFIPYGPRFLGTYSLSLFVSSIIFGFSILGGATIIRFIELISAKKSHIGILLLRQESQTENLLVFRDYVNMKQAMEMSNRLSVDTTDLIMRDVRCFVIKSNLMFFNNNYCIRWFS